MFQTTRCWYCDFGARSQRLFVDHQHPADIGSFPTSLHQHRSTMPNLPNQNWQDVVQASEICLI